MIDGVSRVDKRDRGVSHERGTSTGRHTQGRVRLDVGRQAQEVGYQRPPLRGLGDLPLEGLARRPEPAYASQSSGWFGQQIQRSNDGGKTWEPVGNKFVYDGDPGTHQWYDGTPHPWEFKRVWHLEPSLTDPDTVYAGVEDAALFHSADGGKTWQELPGLRGHGSGPRWQPGAGGHVPAHDPARSERPQADLHRDLGRGRVPDRRRRQDVASRSTKDSGPSTSPTRTPRSAIAFTASRCTRRVRTCCSCRSTGTSCAATTPATRGTRSAATCRPTSDS